jgi:ketosteroid isomerase-like protein
VSRENVETVRRMLAAWSAGRAEEALTYFDPDVVWDQQITPEGWITHGMDEMQQALRTWVGTWSEYSATFDEYLDAGNKVVVVGRERGTAKASGVEVEQPSITVYTLRNRKIIHAKSHKTREAAVTAVGLPDSG